MNSLRCCLLWIAGAIVVCSLDSFTAVAQDPPPANDVTESATEPDASGPPRLKFNFQQQPWDEVLQWLAEQADLSLVLDAPPPGSFNYTDARDYSPSEAIDLINGVLATKGYALLQRERMLMLINLQAGVPRALVPRVSPDEIDQLGRFQLVSVVFPLEGRSAASVADEVRPLVSQYGEVTPLSSSGQLLVIDRAGLMRVIAAAIKSMPVPKTPSKPGEPSKSELRTYPLEGADAAATIEMLEAIFDLKFVHDPAGEKINAYATPSQHAAIGELIEQMRGASEAVRFRLELYPIESFSDEQQSRLLEDLGVVLGDGRMRIDSASQQLVVWASDKDQQLIRRALFKLLAAGSAGMGREPRVYTVKRSDAATVAQQLQPIVPRARLTPGAAGDRIIAVATADEHQLLANLIDRLDASAAASERVIRIHHLQRNFPSELITTLQDLAPRAQIRLDATKRRLTVTGSLEAQTQIEQALTDLQESLGPQVEQSLEIYALDKIQRKRFDSVREAFTENDPDTRIVWKEETGELFVWAGPQRHTEIQQLLNTLKGEPAADTNFRVVAYPFRASELPGIAELIATVAPATKTVQDAKMHRVFVWATDEDHKLIGSFLEHRAGSATRELGDALVLRSYAAPDIDSTLAVRLLTDSFPAATFQVDTTAKTIVAEASQQEHRQIAELIEQLRSGSSTPSQMQVMTYPLGSVSPERAETLRTLFPSLRMSIDPVSQKIFALGTRNDQDQLREALLSLGASMATDRGKVQVYDVGDASATSVANVVRPTVPGATIVPDDASHAIAVLATDPQHSTIQQVVDSWLSQQMDQVTVYQLDHAQADEFVAGLRQVLPTVVAGTVGDDRVMIRAKPDKHRLVAEFIKQMDVQDDTNKRQMVAYPVRLADPTNLVTTLRSLYSEADGYYFSHDVETKSILAVAPSNRHAEIREFVASADQPDKDISGAQAVEVYPLAGIEAQQALTLLTGLFEERGSDVQLSIEQQGNRLIVVAEPQQQAMVRHVLERLQPPEQQFEVFTLDVVDLDAAELAIERLFYDGYASRGNDVAVQSDEFANRLIVRGTRPQLDRVRQLLVKMGELNLSVSAGRSPLPTVRFVPLRVVDPRTVIDEVREVWSTLRPNELQVVPDHRSPSRGVVEPEPNYDGANNNSVHDVAEPQPSNEAQPAEGSINPPDGANTSAAVPSPATSAPPVIVAPARDGVTITSADTEALAHLERLLRALPAGRLPGGANFGVYPLRHASASRLANVLSRAYQRSGRRFGGTDVEFVADERLNAIVVIGRRGDRREIESLLEILDTEQNADLMITSRPVIITLKHASAEQLYDRIQVLYRTALSADGGRPPLDIPSGADPEVVATVAQINAAREGPLLSVDVDPETNALLVMAPRPLIDEIRTLAELVDQQSANTRVGVRVFPLETLEATQMLESLQRVIPTRTR